MQAVVEARRFTAQPQSQITAGMLEDFVRWIDRPGKTEQTYLANLRQFWAWLCYSGCRQPQRADVIAYRDWLISEHPAIKLDAETGWAYRLDGNGHKIQIACKPNTVAQYLRSVCQFFKWTAASGIYPDIAANIHAPRIKAGIHRKDALSLADAAAIEKSLAEQVSVANIDSEPETATITSRKNARTEQALRMYALFLLAVNAGLRTIEISRANVDDFVTINGQHYLYVWGKGRTEADTRKPIAAEVAAALTQYLNARQGKTTGKSPLFTATGNRSGGKRIAPETIGKMIKQAMRGAGFDSERLTAHSLRHTTGTAMQAMTGNLYETQRYMRHSNPATTEIYIHETETASAAAQAQRLYDYMHGSGAAAVAPESITEGLNAEQLKQLAAYAALLKK